MDHLLVSRSIAEDDLLKAAEDGDLDKVKELVEAGLASPNCRTRNYPKGQPIHNACSEGHFEVVEYLLGMKEVDIEASDRDGWTPLFCACDAGHLDIVKLLIEEGANIQHQDESKDTALHRATFSEELEVIKYLIGKGAKVDVKNSEGKTPPGVAKEYPKISEYFSGQMNLKEEIDQLTLKDYESLKDLNDQVKLLKDKVIDGIEREGDLKERFERREIELELDYKKKLKASRDALKRDFVKIMSAEISKKNKEILKLKKMVEELSDEVSILKNIGSEIVESENGETKNGETENGETE